jgi:hypothetical protein
MPYKFAAFSLTQASVHPPQEVAPLSQSVLIMILASSTLIGSNPVIGVLVNHYRDFTFGACPKFTLPLVVGSV